MELSVPLLEKALEIGWYSVPGILAGVIVAGGFVHYLEQTQVANEKSAAAHAQQNASDARDQLKTAQNKIEALNGILKLSLQLLPSRIRLLLVLCNQKNHSYFTK